MARSLSLVVLVSVVAVGWTGAHAQRVSDGLVTLYDFTEGGAFYYVEGHSILFGLDQIIRNRSADLLAKSEHGASLLDDDKVIRFIYAT